MKINSKHGGGDWKNCTPNDSGGGDWKNSKHGGGGEDDPLWQLRSIFSFVRSLVAKTHQLRSLKLTWNPKNR